MDLLIDEMIHFNLALVVGLGCFLIFGNPWLILAALAFGFLIDVDHWFDYFCLFGFKDFSLKKFFKPGRWIGVSGKVYVLLHGWELVPIFWLLGYWSGISGLRWAMSIAYLAHLIWDQASFNHHPLMYFIVYRSIKGFQVKELLK